MLKLQVIRKCSDTSNGASSAAFHHNFLCSVLLVVFYVHFYLFLCAVMIDFPSTSLQKHMDRFQNQKFFRTSEMSYGIPAGLESLKIEFVSEKLNFTFHCGKKSEGSDG